MPQRQDPETTGGSQPLEPGAAPGIQVPVPVAGALTRFAEVSRRLAAWEAAGWTLAALILLFTLVALADRFFLVGEGPRKVAAALGYAAGLLLAVPLVLRALRRRTPSEIARTLESCAPALGLEERLSTTVELAGRSLAGEGVSHQLVERVADEAAQLAETLDVEALPDRTRARRAGRAGLAVLAVALVLCLLPGLNMASFYLRALLPWGRFHRPSNTTVVVTPGSARVVEGASLEVEARLGGQLAKEVWLESREQDSSAWNRLFMDPDPEQPQRFTLKVGPVRVPLQYRIRAGDCLSHEYEVVVLPRPEIAGLRFTLNYPAYTGMPPEKLERISGDLSVLKGARVEVSLRANTALSAAVLDFATGRKLSMSVDGEAAAATFDIAEDTQYRVLLRSTDGVENPDAPLFAIHAIPDRPPQVAVLRPQSDETVDAGQLLNLEARAEDDLGLVGCRLVLRTDMRPGATTVKLERPPEGGKVWLISQPWDLAGFFLQDGETVLYQVEAVDTAGAVGRSDERRLRVASGLKRASGQVLAALEQAQRAVSNAHRLLAGARKDAAGMRQVFRPQDVEFQSAERLLLTETLRRIAGEAGAAAAVLRRITPQAEAGPLRSLLTALGNALERFGDAGVRPLMNGAARANSADGQIVAAALDVLNTLTPATDEKLAHLHQALTAAHRYSGATLLAERAADVREAQAPITPVLLGAAGWGPRGACTPGLLAEYHRGSNFGQLVRRTVEHRFDHKNEDLPEVGRNDFSVRWKGEVLAPRAGRYVFRVTADDGVRLTIAGKRIVDEWRTQTAASFEGAIELTEGWHEIIFEFFQGQGEYEIGLTRSGPKLAAGTIPAEHLRNVGAPAVAVGEDVRNAMRQGASAAAVQQALLRLRTMIQAAAALSPELARLASLPPQRDGEGQKEAAEWGKDVASHSTDLADLRTLSPGLAPPLSQWREHTQTLAARYEGVRKRYRAAVEEWLRRLATDVFEESAKLRELQQTAEAAKKAFESLAETARRPKDENRAAEMARAEAAVRALAEDLKKQAGEIAAEFDAAASDAQRPLEERRLLQALEHRAEEMARGPATALEQRLAEARTPEDLARTQEKIPNFGTNAAELSKQAGELAQWAEKMERAVELREALKETAHDALAAREALSQPPTAEGAAVQKQAAAELRADASLLAQAAEAARNAVDNNTLAKAQQAADQARDPKAPQLLDQRAARALAGKAPQKKDSAEAKASAEADRQLAQEAQKAAEAAAAVNKDLANAAQQLNGEAAQELRQAAQHLQAEKQALAGQPQGNQAQALQQAAAAAEAARENVENTTERLALDAEAARKEAKTDADRNRADDLVKLAAAVHNEAEKQLAPAAEALSRAQQAAAQQAASQQPADNAPAAGQQTPLSQADRAKAAAQAQAEADKLNKLADVAQQLNSGDPNQQKAAREALDKMLAAQSQAQNVAEALKQGEAMDKVAADAAQAGEAASQQPATPEVAAAEAAKLDAAENALAKALNADPAQADRTAMGQRLGEIAQGLREQAEEDRQLADHLGRAAGLEQQARENLKTEAPALAKALRAAQQNAAEAAKGAPAAETAKPLENAQQGLAQAAAATEAAGQKAESAPLGQLAQDLNNTAQGLSRPLGEIADAMGRNSGTPMPSAQRAGQQARQAAGREAELASALTNAQRAGEMAQAEAQAESGDRATLEAQVHAALQTLEKEGALPAASKGSLEKALGQQGGAQQGTPQGTPATAEQARAAGERMAQMAEQMDRLASAMQPEGQPAAGQQAAARNGNTPAANALRALAQAEAAQETAAQGQTAAKAQEAAQELARAAEAARGQASGQETPGSSEAQSMARGKQPGQQQGQSQAQKQGQGKSGAKGAYAAQSQGGLPPEPPQGLPIDKTTWNRLPDNLRRDLLNAAGGRFPAEYEGSIKRYFKNVAADKEERR